MKKRILSILLTLCMVLMLFPVTAFAEEPGSLAITVDGFEVGKTPADTTCSFASTIPGVSFDEKDIKYLRWKILWAGQWEPINETEAFEAGTSYRFEISLKNNGLELVPSTTANGIAPMYSQVVSNNGVPYAINMEFELGTPPEPAPAITINGPDVVCSQQDYEFTATAADGVTIVSAGYGNDYSGGDVMLTPNEDGVLSGVVRASGFAQYGDSFKVTVYGTAADGTPVSGTKTVEVSKKHIYVDGVCGCGAVQQYTVEYIGSGDDPICMDFKTHGKDLTLLGETFTMDGFVQTGWIDEYGAIYDLGDLYTTDADMTFYPYFEKLITLTVPYTTTVALGDVGEPGETTFELALVDYWGDSLAGGNVEVTAAVTTDGAGDYDSALTITGPEQTLWYMLSEGAFVQQVDAGADGWTVDDTVWGLFMSQAAELSNDAATGYAVYVVPASVDSEGGYYINWNLIDWEDPQSADMTFTNTYTKSIAKPTGGDTPKPDTDAVQTGDNRNPALWFALLAVSAAGVIGTGVYSKRRRSSRAK